jgi:hypothetical protein
MEVQHWSNARAIEELRDAGYGNIEDEWDVLSYLEDYQPSWKRSTARAREDMPAHPAFRLAKHVRTKKKKME